MISRLSEKAVSCISHNGLIQINDEELYYYGFFMLISHCLYFLFSILFGAAFRIPKEGILFYTMFFVIRGYAGGIHAKKEIVCTISTTAAMFLSVLAIKVGIGLGLIVIPKVLMVSGILAVFIFSPLDTEAKRLTKEEKRKYKKKACVSAVLIGLIGIAAAKMGSSVLYPCAVSLFLEAVLLIIGKFTQYMHL